MANLKPVPTKAELAILQVLWRQGPCTVREVQEILTQERPTGYTTVLKLMQIMAQKGLVDRDESQRTHVYKSKRPQSQVQRQMVRDLLDRAFEGSASRLVLQALDGRKANKEELKEIRKILDQMEGEE